MLSASTFDSPNSVKTPGGICRQGFFASRGGRPPSSHPLPPPPAGVGAAAGTSRPHRSTCGENMMGWGIQRRGLAAAAATAVVSGGDVAAAAAATAEVAVGSQEPNDDEQDYGVLVQTEKPSVASAVTHNVAPFLRASFTLRRRLNARVAAVRPGWFGWRWCALRFPFRRVHVIL